MQGVYRMAEHRIKLATNSGSQSDRRTSKGQEALWMGKSGNVGDSERLVSTLAGLALGIYGLARFDWKGLGCIAVGDYLIYRGLAGYCFAYDAVGISTTEPDPEGILVDKSILIDSPKEELYRFWLDFEHLPQFMDHLEAVWMIGDHRYHWVAKAPAGMSVEWDADILTERSPDMIAWQSLPGSEIPNEGSVRFEDAPNGEGTIVHVALRYYPPAGKIGAWVAKLFGEEPSVQVEDDLRHFKELMESRSRTF